MSVKYPDINVRLTCIDGNAYSIMTAVIRELKSNGVSDTECHDFREEALSGDYDNVIQTAMRWVNVS